MNQVQFQTVPFTKMVKILVITNLVVWIGLVLILQGLILGGGQVSEILGLVPAHFISDFWVWQIFTYMFVHASGVFHVLFNMLILWWFGAELEKTWGSRFFLTYYLTCGVGAGLVYVLGTLIYYMATRDIMAMAAPLVGASGATFGLLLAFGILFGERVVHFMMIFPMKAKFFVMIIGFIEVVTLLDTGMGSKVSNLAHLGGIAVGFVFLMLAARIKASRASGTKRGRRLKLVVNNDRDAKADSSGGPKYWN